MEKKFIFVTFLTTNIFFNFGGCEKSKECCNNCCRDCCMNCWKCWEEYFGKENENIKEKFFLKEKENTDEEFKKFVNEDWLEKIKNNNVIFKIYEKKEKKDNGEYIEVIKDTEGKIEVKNFNPEPDTGKWALFEIKTTEDNTVYLYCSDIESGETKYNTYGIFDSKENILNISVLTCDTSNVKDMSFMFKSCSSLQEIKFQNNFYTSKVEKMPGMFGLCSSLEKIKFPDIFDTSNVTNMACMFYKCSNLGELDLSKFDTSKVEDIAKKMNMMFINCEKLNKVIVSKNGDTKTKILTQLNKNVGEWEEAKNNIEGNICILIKVEEKK